MALVLAEGATRAVGLQPVLSFEWYLTARTRVPSKDLIMVNPGFLDPGFYKGGEGRTRIVAIGDSFTEGVPVSHQHRYPEVLQDILDERGENAWVLNVGLGNSGPDQHLRLLKEYVLPRIKPDIVVWQFYPNDLGDNTRQAVYDIRDDALVPLDCSGHWIYLRQKVFDYFPLPASVKSKSVLFRLLMKAFEVKREPFPDEAAIVWGGKKIRLALAELDRLASIHGFKTYCPLVAPQSLYLAETDPEKWSDHNNNNDHYRRLRSLLERRPGFIDARFEQVDIFASGDRDRSALGSRHFSEAGYRLLGGVVADRLTAPTDP